MPGASRWRSCRRRSRAVDRRARGRRPAGALRPRGGDGLPLAAPRGRGAADPARRRRGLRALGAQMGVPLLHPWANRLAAWDYEALGVRVDLEPLRGRVVKADGETGLPIHGVMPAAWESLEATPTRLARRARPRPTTRASARHSRSRTGSGSTPSSRPAGCGSPRRSRRSRARCRSPSASTRTSRSRASRGPTTRSSCRRCAGSRSTRARCRPARRRRPPASAGALGDRHLDDGFDRLPDGAAFAVAGGGRRIVVRFESGYPCAQVFAPPGRT